MIPVSLNTDLDRAREQAAARFGGAGQMPAYRAVLDRQGMASAPETVVAGDEHVIEQAIRAYASAGATEVVASLFGDEPDQARTRELLRALRAAVA